MHFNCNCYASPQNDCELIGSTIIFTAICAGYKIMVTGFKRIYKPANVKYLS
jgi:hypothetical protein